MQFPTIGFAAFFIMVYLVSWRLDRSNEWRKIFLLLASWFFYGMLDGRLVALLIVSATVNWMLGRMIHRTTVRSRRRALVAGGVVVNLAILCWFKYAGFLSGQLALALGAIGLARDIPFIDVGLTVGISFFTFQAISYLVEVEKGEMAPAGLLDMTLLMSFFPHLVAGPIVRASDLLPQFAGRPRIDRGMASAAVLLIVWGLFKKTVIASQLASALVEPAFFDPTAKTSFDLLVGAYGYSVQIYCDFSAYSDMAIGLAALLGYRFPRNFAQPYRSATLQEFWRRWHISLSSWLRDYLYIPLGGSRRGPVRTYVNLFTTMLLGGLWHGAAWTFVIWGGLHGTALGLERMSAKLRPARAAPVGRWFGMVLTFHFVTLTWVFFRAESYADASQYLRGLFTADWRNTLVTPLSLALVALGLAIHAVPYHLTADLAEKVRRWPAPALGLATGLAILCIDAMRPPGIAPFIYYQF